MNRKLTAEQVRELASFHKKPAPNQRPTSPATVRFVAQDEAAELLPGIVTQHTVKVKRPPTEGSTHR